MTRKYPYQRPNYERARRGGKWSLSLRSAEKAGAKIVVAETGTPVTYTHIIQPGTYARNWIDSAGNRYDARDCLPYFPDQDPPSLAHGDDGVPHGGS